ncbi:hypothetical protein GGX14DRAFT_397156 [Mycena pura]|uniref:Uncharacterized protein n=1 Tax=Mycena pura TaxID=153505 RepID=A0AAD6VCY6_9AGAR|nr:hypothetical protein GGX14DRAFT_397156 [Mycena pura]
MVVKYYLFLSTKGECMADAFTSRPFLGPAQLSQGLPALSPHGLCFALTAIHTAPIQRNTYKEKLAQYIVHSAIYTKKKYVTQYLKRKKKGWISMRCADQPGAPGVHHPAAFPGAHCGPLLALAQPALHLRCAAPPTLPIALVSAADAGVSRRGNVHHGTAGAAERYVVAGVLAFVKAVSARVDGVWNIAQDTRGALDVHVAVTVFTPTLDSGHHPDRTDLCLDDEDLGGARLPQQRHRFPQGTTCADCLCTRRQYRQQTWDEWAAQHSARATRAGPGPAVGRSGRRGTRRGGVPLVPQIYVYCAQYSRVLRINFPSKMELHITNPIKNGICASEMSFALARSSARSHMVVRVPEYYLILSTKGECEKRGPLVYSTLFVSSANTSCSSSSGGCCSSSDENSIGPKSSKFCIPSGSGKSSIHQQIQLQTVINIDKRDFSNTVPVSGARDRRRATGQAAGDTGGKRRDRQPRMCGDRGLVMAAERRDVASHNKRDFVLVFGVLAPEIKSIT